ncbi:methylated-DNA--[protein]-cysteine S-methyltransferase [Luteibaculum oceani]|uniref:methylated-DNA--[protein]-cysteine S-methyltransferase n=1 Tax=Luteibaculum oceani TaxID=1294296 RepID=A0A5C6UT22_9FLAO|nr:methylated-DNA--[protein]-cysteine S-methyltransferase [Luteibaculum oceani]TXC76129.1 methylated-DNA--[protein]-cysteine S-methyltransferase [Luteibaculum oceani]
MPSSITTTFYTTPFGELFIGSYQGKICLCDWKHRKQRNVIDKRIARGLGADFKSGEDSVIKKTIAELEQYFAGEKLNFDIPLWLVGTSFQQSIWIELQKIPYGETLSYKQLASNIASDNSVRAVAAANGANAVSILIPCHRVIGSNGNLMGYAGGLKAKKGLLTLEGSLKQSNQVLLPLDAEKK